jgi:hypothetical protein
LNVFHHVSYEGAVGMDSSTLLSFTSL